MTISKRIFFLVVPDDFCAVIVKRNLDLKQPYDLKTWKGLN